MDFFIAHASVDRKRARELAKALERRRHRAYVPGVAADAVRDATAADERALREAAVCVVLVTAQGDGDAAHQASVTAAVEHWTANPLGRRVVPVLLDGVTAGDLRQRLRLANLAAIEPQAIVADKVAVVAQKLDDLARRLATTATPERVRVAVVGVEAELSEAMRATVNVLAPLAQVGGVEMLDAARPETAVLALGFDFAVVLVGARLGHAGVIEAVLALPARAAAKLAEVDLDAVPEGEFGPLRKLRATIADKFTNTEGAAALARERVVTWLQERFPTPSGGQGLLERWERDYLTKKRVEWAGSRHGPLSAYAGERDLRRAMLYVSLFATPQPWCHIDKDGRFVVKSREEVDPRQRAKGRLPEDVEMGREEKDARPPFLEQVVSHADLPVIVLEGEGGSGKTALLQQVAYILACRHLGEALPGEHHLDLATLQQGAPLLRVPVLLDARRIAEAIDDHGIESAIREAIAKAFSGVEVVTPSQVLDGLRHGRYLLLVDALDEVPGVAMRDRVLHALAAEAAKATARTDAWPLRLVLTTRPAAYTGVALPRELPALQLAPMTEGDAERLIERWAQAQGRPADERAKLREAVLGVRERHGIDNVLENPLLLTCLLLVYEQRKRLPDSTAALYERMVEVLCTAKDNPAVKPEEKRQALEILCRGMQEQGGTAWALDAAVEALTAWRPGLLTSRDKAEDFVSRLALETGLLRLEQQRTKGKAEVRLVRPWHRSFQEYLSARSLAAGAESVEDKTQGLFLERARGGARVEDPAWEGVLRFLAGVHGQAGDANARRYVETLHAAVRDPKRREGRILGLVASALSEYAECFEGHDLLTTVPREIVDAFEARGAKWPWRDRVLALDALGRLPGGDPRLKSDPWVKFEAGRFTMGGDAKAHQSAPEHEARVGEFWLRRWPVTVSEYEEFVKAGGYKDPSLWDVRVDETEPWWWQAQRRHPNRPVVGVNWFEARGFCRWANAAGWAPVGRAITLPTEEEWEYAARGGGRKPRTYAWGNENPGEGDKARASYGGYLRNGNVPESATPVGAFPTGHSPKGVWDLTGNVLEWTACRWREGEKGWRQSDTECHQDDIVCRFDDKSCHHDDKVSPGDARQSLSAAPRVLRGGSWDNGPGNLRAAVRNNWLPEDRLGLLGFRVVCVCSRQHA